MASPRDDQARYRPTFGTSSARPTSADTHGAGFFNHSGPVPALQFTQQPRSSSSHPASRSIWNGAPQQPPTHQPQVQHATYEQQDPRYTSQPSSHHTQTAFEPSPRQPVPVVSRSSRTGYLPPLNVPPNSGRDDRWQPPAPYPSEPTRESTRSPTNASSYTVPYSSYSTLQSSGYGPGYEVVPERRQPQSPPVQAQPPTTRGSSSTERGSSSRTSDLRATSPYARRETSSVPPPTYTAPPAPPSGDDAIKKKRKRADAAQLKVLNDVYARTAFPSTDERADLARQLDMTPRSVQIWFQNKRQSMRASTRQPPVTSSSHQSFAMPTQANIVEEEFPSDHYVHSTSSHYPSTSQYPRSSSSVNNYESTYSSTHRHAHNDEIADSRRWASSGRGY